MIYDANIFFLDSELCNRNRIQYNKLIIEFFSCRKIVFVTRKFSSLQEKILPKKIAPKEKE